MTVKRGRGRPAHPRTKRVMTRLTEEEFARFTEEAQAMGLDLSSLIRLRLYEGNPQQGAPYPP